MSSKASMGLSTSGSRVNVTPKTSSPPSSKVVSNTAHGVNMKIKAGGDKMYLEMFPKGGGERTSRGDSDTHNFAPKGPKPKAC